MKSRIENFIEVVGQINCRASICTFVMGHCNNDVTAGWYKGGGGERVVTLKGFRKAMHISLLYRGGGS